MDVCLYSCKCDELPYYIITLIFTLTVINYKHLYMPTHYQSRKDCLYYKDCTKKFLSCFLYEKNNEEKEI